MSLLLMEAAPLCIGDVDAECEEGSAFGRRERRGGGGGCWPGGLIETASNAVCRQRERMGRAKNQDKTQPCGSRADQRSIG
jgi:hypothetical protein